MRTSLKLLRAIALCMASLLLAVCLSACGEKSMDAVTDVTFDFLTGDYSFTGVDGAESYRVRIFPVEEDGSDSELPINESNDLRGGEESYSGNVPVWSLESGATYRVYVLAKGEDDLSSVSEAVEGVYVANYETVDSARAWYDEGKTTITVSLNSNSAVSDYYASGASYEITLYKDGAAQETATIANADITETDGSYTGAEVTFPMDAPDAAYTVTVKVLTADENVYFDSEESEQFSVVAEADLPEENNSFGGFGS